MSKKDSGDHDNQAGHERVKHGPLAEDTAVVVPEAEPKKNEQDAVLGPNGLPHPPLVILLSGRKGHNSGINGVYSKVEDKDAEDGFSSYQSNTSRFFLYWRPKPLLESKGRWYIGASLKPKHGYFGYLEEFTNFSHEDHGEHWFILEHGAWLPDDRIQVQPTNLLEAFEAGIMKNGGDVPGQLAGKLTIWHRLFMRFTAMTSKYPLLTMLSINIIINTVSASMLKGYELENEQAEQAELDANWNVFDQSVKDCTNSIFLGDAALRTRCYSLASNFRKVEGNCRRSAGPSIANDWDYSGALLYMITISTTVGYGSVTPSTYDGKVFTMCITLVCIPAFVVFLAVLGNQLVGATATLISAVTMKDRPMCKACMGYGKSGDILPSGEAEVCHVCDGLGTTDVPPPSQSVVTAVTLILFLLFIVLMGTTVYKDTLWSAAGGDGVAPSSEWSYMEGVYFAVISFTTVGLGDFNYLNGAPTGVLVTYVITLLVGLAGVATLFSSIQEALGTLEKGYHPEDAIGHAEAELKAMDWRKSIADELAGGATNNTTPDGATAAGAKPEAGVVVHVVTTVSEL